MSIFLEQPAWLSGSMPDSQPEGARFESEVGSIFSERYLARKGVEKRERKRIGRNCEGDLGLERVGKIIFFLVT